MSIYYDKEGEPISLDQFVRFMGDPKYKRIDETKVGESIVSTVWLGLDHGFSFEPRAIFESMVFGGELDGEQERYATEEEARKGHERMVARVRGEVEARGGGGGEDTLARLRRRLEEATPGPWRTSGHDPAVYGRRDHARKGGAGQVARASERYMDRGERLANAALIADAVSTLPALLDVAEAARAWLDWIEDGEARAPCPEPCLGCDLRNALNRLEKLP